MRNALVRNPILNFEMFEWICTLQRYNLPKHLLTRYMNFKPNEFFIGLVEFITILLPGAVLMLIVLYAEKGHPSQENHFLYQYALSEETSTIFWVFFTFSSFGLGYFLSSVASGLDHLYDMIRKQIYPYEENLRHSFKSLSGNQKIKYVEIYENKLKRESKKEEIIKELPEKEKSFEGFKIQYTGNFFRRLLFFFFELEFTLKMDESFEQAKRILEQQPPAVRKASNVFKWASTILEAQYPAINDQATRIMAASKFFRSMVVVSFVFFLLQILNQSPFSFWVINCIILVFSFREYIVQRQKCLQKTYQSIVSLSCYEKPSAEIAHESSGEKVKFADPT